MTPKERAAMQQALEALELLWGLRKIDEAEAAITALREALADPQITTPDVCGEVCARAKLCYGCNKDLEEANAKYAEQAEQRSDSERMEPVMDYERLNALREGEQNGAEDAYFFVRPENDTPTLRKMFCNGFERGFHKGLKYAAPVEPVKQEPVAWMDLHKELGKLRWMGGDEGWDNAINAVRDRLIELATPHPVRTKDLSDDEERQIITATVEGVTVSELAMFKAVARAVIAADREKNK